jgi:oxygen-independent coproporphyrinogen-3 oxidase
VGDGAGRDLGVYVHVPFCDRVCPYCDFAVEAVGRLAPEVEGDYVDALLCELELVRARPELELAGRRLATIYLGGGTPSLLSPGSIERLLAALRAAFPGEPEEVTLELNPGVLEIERVPGFRRAGVTRFSVGVQSFDDTGLRRLGRAHRGADALRGLEAALAADGAGVSADLILGWPGQTEADLLADLDRLLGFGVDHVSTYALTIEPGTPFARARERLKLPDEDSAVRFDRIARAQLAAAGYEHYEISNFARPGRRSRHNQRSWLRQDVLGLGMSASSFLAGRRLKNAARREDWRAALRAGRPAWSEAERLTCADARRETLYLGLRRLDGVRRADYLRSFGAPPERHFPDALRELAELGLLCDEVGCLRLTERGILFSDEVFLRFVGR